MEDNLNAVRLRIQETCARVGRGPDEVTLIAVSKRHSVEAIERAYRAGQRRFGENYVQELADKAVRLAHLPDIEWHLIGHLQRNKAKQIVSTGAWIDSVDSARLARELGDRAARTDHRVSLLVQVNVAREVQKSGCSIEELPEVVAAVQEQSALRLEGLMTMAPYAEDPEAARPTFVRLRQLADEYRLTHRSMGMTADLEVAIEEGATMVRVGTAIFGARTT